MSVLPPSCRGTAGFFRIYPQSMQAGVDCNTSLWEMLHGETVFGTTVERELCALSNSFSIVAPVRRGGDGGDDGGDDGDGATAPSSFGSCSDKNTLMHFHLSNACDAASNLSDCGAVEDDGIRSSGGKSVFSASRRAVVSASRRARGCDRKEAAAVQCDKMVEEISKNGFKHLHFGKASDFGLWACGRIAEPQCIVLAALSSGARPRPEQIAQLFHPNSPARTAAERTEHTQGVSAPCARIVLWDNVLLSLELWRAARAAGLQVHMPPTPKPHAEFPSFLREFTRKLMEQNPREFTRKLMEQNPKTSNALFVFCERFLVCEKSREFAKNLLEKWRSQPAGCLHPAPTLSICEHVGEVSPHGHAARGSEKGVYQRVLANRIVFSMLVESANHAKSLAAAGGSQSTRRRGGARPRAGERGEAALSDILKAASDSQLIPRLTILSAGTCYSTMSRNDPGLLQSVHFRAVGSTFAVNFQNENKTNNNTICDLLGEKQLQVADKSEPTLVDRMFRIITTLSMHTLLDGKVDVSEPTFFKGRYDTIDAAALITWLLSFQLQRAAIQRWVGGAVAWYRELLDWTFQTDKDEHALFSANNIGTMWMQHISGAAAKRAAKYLDVQLSLEFVIAEPPTQQRSKEDALAGSIDAALSVRGDRTAMTAGVDDLGNLFGASSKMFALPLNTIKTAVVATITFGDGSRQRVKYDLTHVHDHGAAEIGGGMVSVKGSYACPLRFRDILLLNYQITHIILERALEAESHTRLASPGTAALHTRLASPGTAALQGRGVAIPARRRSESSDDEGAEMVFGEDRWNVAGEDRNKRADATARTGTSDTDTLEGVLRSDDFFTFKLQNLEAETKAETTPRGDFDSTKRGMFVILGKKYAENFVAVDTRLKRQEGEYAALHLD